MGRIDTVCPNDRGSGRARDKLDHPCDLVVIAGSAGSLDPLREIVRGLGGYAGTVLVVIHVPPGAPSTLPALLSRVGTLPVRHAADGDPLEPGTILVAPPDRHLLVEDARVRLGAGPRENGARPAADALFRTCAHAHGSRVAGIILSGALDDGARGLAAVKEHGGTTIVQRPDQALFSGMPQSAIDHVDVDYVLAIEQIAPLVQDLQRGAGKVRTRREPLVGRTMPDAPAASRLEGEGRWGTTDQRTRWVTTQRCSSSATTRRR